MNATPQLARRKPAPTRREIHPLLRERYSPHAFQDEPVERETLTRLFEAARWAASSFNEQPWRFLVADRFTHPDRHDALVDVLAEGNQAWASDAPVLVLTLAKTRFELNGDENPHARHDVGQAIAQLTVQATAEGLGVHQMGGFDADAARETFGLPDELDPVTVVAIGHPSSPDGLPDELAERDTAPRQRAPLEEILVDDALP